MSPTGKKEARTSYAWTGENSQDFLMRDFWNFKRKEKVENSMNGMVRM